ncbi:TonB-dependent receptor [Dokdonella sp.]|uniref:TonB-dependent receptor n=1 Tax=Dokdonella sp. TaxID=2291710 RepID=UPI001B0DB5B3|nr:TonB-dependent receptor [Dokdonella sp.]MBO9664580.1 TonB-dependent receptor [Dokdonella sp.]
MRANVFVLAGMVFLSHVCGAFASNVPASRHAYRLPGGELAGVLGELAERSGIQILFEAKLLAGRRSAGLDGDYSIESALAELLRGSGLEAVAVTPNTFVVKRTPKPATKAETRELHVTSPEPVRPTELSTVTVKDASLQRLAVQGVMPVTEITREQIDSSGYLTLFDLLKAQPGMQVANQPEAMASASDSSFKTGASGAAAVALRWLGSKSTLFLVDGRRIAGYGLPQDATGTVSDLNSIPLAMVERIEILRDGASAIYGSDAVAGVVNLILRHDFSSAEFSQSIGQSSRGDAATQQSSFLWGKRTESGIGLLLNVAYLHGDPLLGDRRSWYTLDQRRQGLLDARSQYSFRGNYLYLNKDNTLRRAAAPGCQGTLSDDGLCLLDGARYTTLQNGKVGKSLLGRVEMPLGESTRVYANLRANDLHQSQQAAPSAATVLLPFESDQDPVALLYSFNDIGPVRETTDSNLLSVDTGARGSVGNWSWNLDASAQRNRVDDRIDGLVRSNVLSFGEESYSFGEVPPSRALRDAMAPQVRRKGVTTLNALSLEASGAAFDLPAGAVSTTAGVEIRREGIEQQPDETLTAGKLLNQPAEYVQSFDRNASAAYVMFELPIAERFDASLAWRQEKTAGFSSHGSPTFGLRWNPLDSLILRASRSSGFRAPTLFELHQPRSVAAASSVWVPQSAGPCERELVASEGRSLCELDVSTSGNLSLRPEKTRTTAFGAVWAPSSTFSLSLDVYRSVRNDEIAIASPAYVLDHPEQFGDILQRNGTGQLTALRNKLANLAQTTTSGSDLDARWDFGSENVGRFQLTLGLNYLDRLDRRVAPGVATARSAGYADTPRLTGVSSLRWTRGDWSGAAHLRYVGSYSLEPYAEAGTGCPEYKNVQGKCSIPPFSLLNLNLTYGGVPRWAFTLSVNNALDHTPRYYDEAAAGFNAAFDDAIGRYYALRVTHRF